MSKIPLILGANAWSLEYDGTVEPDADTPAWTLAGASVDHATVTSADFLRIASCGTDLDYYTKAPSANNLRVFALFRVRVPGGVSNNVYKAQVAALDGAAANCREVYVNFNDGALSIVGATTTAVTMDTAARWITVAVLLDRPNNSYSVWVNGVVKVSGGTPASSGSASLIGFGKYSATDDDSAVDFDMVAYLESSSEYIQPWPRVAYHDAELDSVTDHSVAYDGTIETLHARVDRFFSWQAVGLSQSDVDTLRAFYVSYMAPGTELLYIPDITDPEAAEHKVKCMEKSLRPRQMVRRFPIFSAPIRLRKTD